MHAYDTPQDMIRTRFPRALLPLLAALLLCHALPTPQAHCRQFLIDNEKYQRFIGSRGFGTYHFGNGEWVDSCAAYFAVKDRLPREDLAMGNTIDMGDTYDDFYFKDCEIYRLLMRANHTYDYCYPPEGKGEDLYARLDLTSFNSPFLTDFFTMYGDDEAKEIRTYEDYFTYQRTRRPQQAPDLKEAVGFYDTGFTLRRTEGNDTFVAVAQADIDGNGQCDWIVQVKHASAVPPYFDLHEYIAVLNPDPVGLLRAKDLFPTFHDPNSFLLPGERYTPRSQWDPARRPLLIAPDPPSEITFGAVRYFGPEPDYAAQGPDHAPPMPYVFGDGRRAATCREYLGLRETSPPKKPASEQDFLALDEYQKCAVADLIRRRAGDAVTFDIPANMNRLLFRRLDVQGHANAIRDYAQANTTFEIHCIPDMLHDLGDFSTFHTEFNDAGFTLRTPSATLSYEMIAALDIDRSDRYDLLVRVMEHRKDSNQAFLSYIAVLDPDPYATPAPDSAGLFRTKNLFLPGLGDDNYTPQ